MRSPIRIESADDPRIAAYKDIRDRDIVGRQGRFVAEGSVVLRKLLGSTNYAPESALILENRIDGLDEALNLLHERDIPVYVADRGVIDAIAGFPMHRGVLAVGKSVEPESGGALLGRLPHHSLVIVCVGVSNHDNMGAIFRNAAGFGADAVFYDASCCDPLYRKAIRVSVGSVFELPHVRVADVHELRRQLAAAGFQQLALTPAGSIELHQVEPSARRAIYLGTEGEGLPGDLIRELAGVRIDMRPGFDSLNVATAGAIALYELTIGRRRGR